MTLNLYKTPLQKHLACSLFTEINDLALQFSAVLLGTGKHLCIYFHFKVR